MGDDDFEREREEYFERARGVGEGPSGQFWGWSSYARGEIPAFHPAMLGRKRGPAPRTRVPAWVPPTVFLALIIGVPALAVFLAQRGSTALIVVLSNLTGLVMVAAVLLAYRRVRLRKRAFEPHKHGHHRPHRHR